MIFLNKVVTPLKVPKVKKYYAPKVIDYNLNTLKYKTAQIRTRSVYAI